MATDDAAEFAYANARNVLLSNAAILDCYRTPAGDIDAVLGPAAKTCKELALREYGPRIPASELLNFSRDIGGCMRSIVLQAVNVSEKELLECSKRIR
jgi:hypothetical protein